MKLFIIFFTYIKIGLMAFGGGYVILPLIESEFVNKQQIISAKEVYSLFALAQSVPGIIAVNMAIFLGYRLGKTAGAIVAAIGVMLPSIVIISVVAVFFDRFADLPWVQKIFKGLNIAVLAIITHAMWKMAKTGMKDAVTIGIFIVVLAAYLITGFNPVIFSLLGCAAGLLLAGRGEAHV